MLTIARNASRYDWATWLMGASRAFIAAGAGAIASPVGPMVLDPNDFNLGSGLKKVLVSMLITGILTGITGMAIFLKTHPGPDPLQVALQAAADEANKAVVQAKHVSDVVQDAKSKVENP